jgi:hypothetical protein
MGNKYNSIQILIHFYILYILILYVGFYLIVNLLYIYHDFLIHISWNIVFLICL